jgi:hypothetical protein
MSEHPVSRYAQLLSKGQLLQGNTRPEPGIPGTPQMYHNGLGRYFVGRPIVNSDFRITIEYAPDPERVLELAATTIRRNRFGSPKYDQDQHFPLTRRLSYAAFPDMRPKNQAVREPREFHWEYLENNGTGQAWNV